jgi:hypothetical protein
VYRPDGRILVFDLKPANPSQRMLHNIDYCSSADACAGLPVIVRPQSGMPLDDYVCDGSGMGLNKAATKDARVFICEWCSCSIALLGCSDPRSCFRKGGPEDSVPAGGSWVQAEAGLSSPKPGIPQCDGTPFGKTLPQRDVPRECYTVSLFGYGYITWRVACGMTSAVCNGGTMEPNTCTCSCPFGKVGLYCESAAPANAITPSTPPPVRA